MLIILTASFFIFQSTCSTFAIESKETKKVLVNNTQVKSVDKITIISESEAAKIGKNILKSCFNIEIGDTNKGFSIGLILDDNSHNHKTNWFIGYENYEKEKLNIYITIDATNGKIHSIENLSPNILENKSQNYIAPNKTKEIFDNIVKILEPDKFKELSSKELSKDKSNLYSYYGFKKVNDIESPNNNITIIIDGVTGTIMNYKCNWNDTSILPSNDTENFHIITKNKAMSLCKSIIKNFYKYEIKDNNFSNSGPKEGYFSALLDKDGCDNKYFWCLDCTIKDGATKKTISIKLNAINGNLHGISIMPTYDSKISSKSKQIITYKQAQTIADNFIKKIDPTRINKTSRIYYGNYYDNYKFNYVMNYKNAKIDINYMSLDVNMFSGEVSYSEHWNDKLVIPDAKRLIDNKKAENIFKNSLKMKLSYSICYNESEKSNNPYKAKLIYSPIFKNGTSIDAKTGKPINTDSFYNSNLNESPKTISNDLTPKEKNAFSKKYHKLNPQKKPMNKKQAEALINKLIKQLYKGTYKIDQITNNKHKDGNKNVDYWKADFHKTQKEISSDHTIASISINAYTGEIVNCDHSPFYTIDTFTTKLSRTEAYYKAIDVITKYYPNLINKLSTQQHYTKNYDIKKNQKVPFAYHTAEFEFPRMENGIICNENILRISIDLNSGAVNYISLRWNPDLVFPSTKKILSEKSATSKFFQKNKVKLHYDIIINNDKLTPTFIYKLDYKSAQLDATSGELIYAP